MRRRLRVSIDGPAVGEWLTARYGPGAIAPTLGRDMRVAAGIYIVGCRATFAGDLAEVELEVGDDALRPDVDVHNTGALLVEAIDAVNLATGDALSRARQARIELVDA